jgi:hypothetical protein
VHVADAFEREASEPGIEVVDTNYIEALGLGEELKEWRELKA